MKNALLIHGWADKKEFYDPEIPTASNFHWFPWLSKQLMIRDIHTVAVEMPRGYYPHYETWRKEFERYDIHEDTILVGHSCGAGFLVRWLSENNTKVGDVFLVAPWMGIDFGNPNYDKNFFKFDIDPDLAKKTRSLHILNSSNDMSAVQQSVDLLRSSVDGIEYHEYKDMGHFCMSDLGDEAFPQLLKEILK